MGNSSSSMAAPVVVNATAKHTASVIFFHGLGDTGHGWAEQFSSIKRPHIRYVCPTAHSIPVTLNGNMRMPAWFDIHGLEVKSKEDEAGIKEAAELVQHYIFEEEKKGIKRDRIMIGGFSQGGAIAVYSALAHDKPPLAGIVALSTWLPLYKTFPGALKANRDTPIFQCHGVADPLVPYTLGKLTEQTLSSLNHHVKFQSYDGMAHSSCEQEIKDVQEFIDDCLAPEQTQTHQSKKR